MELSWKIRVPHDEELQNMTIVPILIYSRPLYVGYRPTSKIKETRIVYRIVVGKPLEK